MTSQDDRACPQLLLHRFYKAGSFGMGLYERDYGREDETPWDRHQREQSQQPMSMTVIVLIVTCVIHVIDVLTSKKIPVSELFPDGGAESPLVNWFACYKETLFRPWQWYQFLTYGFLHDQRTIMHIAFNMLNLFIFGRMVEQRVGRWELLRFYLVSMTFAGLIGSVTYWAMNEPDGMHVIGASGAVSALLIVFVCFDPQATLLLMGAIPIKAWWLGAAFLVMNIYGSLTMFTDADKAMGGGTAFTVHLAGAAFGYFYHRQHWNLEFLSVAGYRDRFGRSIRRTKLKIHDPDAKLRKEEYDVDQILAKIHATGEESLTRAERRTLEKHSRRKREGRNRN